MIHRKKNDLLHKNATYNNLWQGVVVNRLKIPPGLFTLKYRRWSEVPSRGGVHGGFTVRKTTCSTKMPHICLCHSLWQGEFVNRLKIPQGLSTLKCRRWRKFPKLEGSAVIHRKKTQAEDPQFLSLLLLVLHRWSEVSSRGKRPVGERGDTC